jgi:hypothetical protein
LVLKLFNGSAGLLNRFANDGRHGARQFSLQFLQGERLLHDDKGDLLELGKRFHSMVMLQTAPHAYGKPAWS